MKAIEKWTKDQKKSELRSSQEVKVTQIEDSPDSHFVVLFLLFFLFCETFTALTTTVFSNFFSNLKFYVIWCIRRTDTWTSTGQNKPSISFKRLVWGISSSMLGMKKFSSRLVGARLYLKGLSFKLLYSSLAWTVRKLLVNPPCGTTWSKAFLGLCVTKSLLRRVIRSDSFFLDDTV